MIIIGIQIDNKSKNEIVPLSNSKKTNISSALVNTIDEEMCVYKRIEIQLRK